MQGLKIRVSISCCTPLYTDRCFTPLRVSVICRKLMKCVDDHKYQKTKHRRLATKPVILKVFVLCCTFATHLPFANRPISKPSFCSAEMFSSTLRHSNKSEAAEIRAYPGRARELDTPNTALQPSRVSHCPNTTTALQTDWEQLSPSTRHTPGSKMTITRLKGKGCIS